MRKIVPLILLAFLAAITTGFSMCAPRAPLPGEGVSAPTPPTTPPLPPEPELKIVKVAGNGKKNQFTVKLAWNGKDPTEWKIARWTLMRDRTNQSQSLLVLSDQVFKVESGEYRLVTVNATCINPDKPPARALIVDYPGMPIYELTTKIEDNKVAALIQAVQEVGYGMQAMMPRLKFLRSGEVELTKPQPKEDLYLNIVNWDASAQPPIPYVAEDVIDAALVVTVSGGMDSAKFVQYFQGKHPGVSAKDSQREMTRLQPQVNKLLQLANLSERLGKAVTAKKPAGVKKRK